MYVIFVYNVHDTCNYFLFDKLHILCYNVHKQDYADNGQIVVMLIDGEEAVVKRYFCDTARAVVRLESYNPEYPPRVFRGAEIERLKILGVAKRVITDL